MSENIRILKEQLEAAKGMRPFDTLIKNVKIVNVFTEEIIPGSIGIYGQRIVVHIAVGFPQAQHQVVAAYNPAFIFQQCLQNPLLIAR